MRHDITPDWTKPRLSVCLLLVVISQSLAIAISEGGAERRECFDFEYRNKQGFCCDKCRPGFKLKQECLGQLQRSNCEKCENGTYTEQTNYAVNCFRCTNCNKPNMVEISKCTVTKNSVCGCESGYYLKKLDPLTWECRRCKPCQSGQRTTKNCTEEGYKHCECEENHYREKPNSCKPCVSCREECKHLCNTTLTTVRTTPPTDTVSTILVPVFACVMAVAVGMFFVYEGIRIWRKKKRALLAQLSSHDTEAKPESESTTQTIPEKVPLTNTPCETEQGRELPDCIPKEIKIHEFFYFALDEIPVARFKELVRRLGISEQDIERAEQDHRMCKDAHYQMLKVWSDRGREGGNNILPSHLIQMFIDTLRDMYLASCADSIENKFLS